MFSAANDRTATDSYDANGNLTFNGQQNVYDFENRLVQRGGVNIVYDGDGNRVQETVAGVVTKYLTGEVNPTGDVQVLAELSNTNQMLRGYMWGLQLAAVRDFTVNSGGIFHYYGLDGHGSVRFLTDSTGAVTDTYDYDAFGNLINSTGSTVNNYLFAGEQFDPALGIYYNRARYYDQRQGRFWTGDTFEGDPQSPASLHKYLYAGANPVMRRDPTGNFDLASTVVTSGIIGTLSGALVGGISGGAKGAINGAIQGAIFGTLFPLGGAGLGTALLGSAARGVFITGIGGLIGGTVVSGYSLATGGAQEQKGAAASLALTVAFAFLGPSFLQAANTRSFQAEQINAEFIAQGQSPPYAGSTGVTETTIFRPMSYVRVFLSGKNPVGVWFTEPGEIAGLTPAQVQAKLALPYEPTHIEVVNLPAGSTIRMGIAAENFNQPGGGFQVEFLGKVDPSYFGPPRSMF